jgi:hypothetical protein
VRAPDPSLLYRNKAKACSGEPIWRPRTMSGQGGAGNYLAIQGVVASLLAMPQQLPVVPVPPGVGPLPPLIRSLLSKQRGNRYLQLLGQFSSPSRRRPSACWTWGQFPLSSRLWLAISLSLLFPRRRPRRCSDVTPRHWRLLSYWTTRRCRRADSGSGHFLFWVQGGCCRRSPTHGGCGQRLTFAHTGVRRRHSRFNSCSCC